MTGLRFGHAAGRYLYSCRHRTGRQHRTATPPVGHRPPADEPRSARSSRSSPSSSRRSGCSSAMGLLWGVAFHWVDLALLVGALRGLRVRDDDRLPPLLHAPRLRDRRRRQGDARDPRLHDDAGADHAVGHRPPQAPRALRPGRATRTRRTSATATARWGAVKRLRPRPRRLALHEPRHGAGPRLRQGSLRGPARPDDRPALPALGRAHARDPVRDRLRGRRHLAAPGVEGLVWGGLLRIFLYQHATFSVNSICHMFGRQDYRSRDEARNNWLVALLVFGEGWHNNHHAFPASARHGLRPLADRPLLVGDPRARAARARLGRARCRTRAAARRGAGVQRRSRGLSARARARGPARARAAAAPAGPRRAQRDRRAARRGSACTPLDAERARALEAAPRAAPGETPGMPGQPAVERAVEHVEALAAQRLEPSSRSGIHGASPSTRLDRRLVGAAIATAPPIEKPSSSVRVARRPRRSRRARPRRTARAASTT